MTGLAGYSTANAVNGQIAAGTGGNFFFGPQTRLAKLSSGGIQGLELGAGVRNVPTAGYIRAPYNSFDTEPILAGADATGRTVALLTWLDSFGDKHRLHVGNFAGGSYPGVKDVYLGATGGNVFIELNGANEYTFGVTGAAFAGNAVTDVGTASFRAGSDVFGVRRYNNVDGLAQYGNLPDSNTDIVGQSGPRFFIPSSVSAARTYALIPTMGTFGDAAFIDNRSAFTCTINQTGTGMGTPSGTLMVLPPTMGAAFHFGSGFWEYDSRYRLSGGP